MSIELSNGRRLVWNWSNFLHEDVRPRIIDTATDTEICALEGHSDYVRDALELHDGRLLTWSKDRTLRIWRTSDGACETVFQKHQAWIANAMEPQPGLILSWDGEGWIQVWNAASGESRHEIAPPETGMRNDVRGVLLANAERMLILHESQVRLLDTLRFTPIATLSVAEQGFFVDMQHLPPAHFLIHDHEQAAVHALDDGRYVAGFELRGYETKLLALRDGRLLALHWWRGKRHVADLWQPLSAERIATLEFDGERVTHIAERTDGEVLLALEDYRCLLLGTQPLALRREAALVSDEGSGFASFDPHSPQIVESAEHSARNLRALRARWLGARETDAITLRPDRQPTSVRLRDGRLLLRKGIWPGAGLDEPFELFDIRSGTYDEIAATALEALDPHAWRSLLDLESLQWRRNGLERRMACLTGVPLEAVENTLAPLRAQQSSNERGLSFIPVEGGAIVCQQWQPEAAAWWIDHRPGSAAVEMLPLFEQTGCEWFANRPLIAPDGTLHVLREGRLAPLMRPDQGGVVRVPLVYRNRFPNIRWCARDRILVQDFDGVAVYDATDLSRPTRLEGGHGVANWGIHELRDGTLVAYSRSALRSWHAEDLSPLVELRDPVDWGPGREVVLALHDTAGLAFCAGQYSMDTRVVLWNGKTELLVFGAHPFEVLNILDLGDGWMASLSDDSTQGSTAEPIWRIWRVPEALWFER